MKVQNFDINVKRDGYDNIRGWLNTRIKERERKKRETVCMYVYIINNGKQPAFIFACNPYFCLSASLLYELCTMLSMRIVQLDT